MWKQNVYSKLACVLNVHSNPGRYILTVQGRVWTGKPLLAQDRSVSRSVKGVILWSHEKWGRSVQLMANSHKKRWTDGLSIYLSYGFFFCSCINGKPAVLHWMALYQEPSTTDALSPLVNVFPILFFFNDFSFLEWQAFCRNRKPVFSVIFVILWRNLPFVH